MVLVEQKRTDKGMLPGKELLVYEPEMLTRMDDENVFHGKGKPGGLYTAGYNGPSCA